MFFPTWAAAQPPPGDETGSPAQPDRERPGEDPPAAPEARPAATAEEVPNPEGSPAPAEVPTPSAAPSATEVSPPLAASPSKPAPLLPPPVPVDLTPSEGEVDVISAAGRPTPPPKRGPSIVLAETGPQVIWDPRWSKFALGNYILSGLSLGVALGSLAIPPAETRWTTINGFDAEVRDALRANEPDDRDRARDASDILLMVSINQILVDTLLVTWWGHNADTVAYEMALMNIEALTVNSAINGLVTGLASRERPYREDCVGEADTELRDCRTSKRYRSFYSGHTSTTFAVAGLTCIHHAYLPLYGGGVGDVIPCVASFGVAAATGALRVVSDQHFASDVLVGAAVGTLTGLTVPYFLHYRTGDLPDASPDRVSWVFVPTPFGANLGGTF